MPLHLTGITDEPERPEQPDDLDSVAGEGGGDGVRHGDCLPCALLDSFSDVHGNAIRNYSRDAVAPRECRITATGNVSVVQCDKALTQRNSRACYHTADPSEKRKEIADAESHASRGAGLVTGDTFASRNSGGDPAPATSRSAINPSGDRGGAGDVEAERTVAVTCPVCGGRGSNAHIISRPCTTCWGIGSLRIEVAPDTTGIAPNWARFHATLADRYDGAPDAGRASTIGCGQTPDEAVADLLERLE